MKNKRMGRLALGAALLQALVYLPIQAQAAAPAYYDLSIVNTFANGDYYGATPPSEDIWILSDLKFEYLNASDTWTTVNSNPVTGTYGSAIQLSQIKNGSVRLYTEDQGSRVYAILSNGGGTAPTHSDIPNKPNNYFEWSFDSSGNPGTIDLSWIDSWDFTTRLQVNTTGSVPSTTFGGSAQASTARVAANLKSYLSNPNYAWLAVSSGPDTGFSSTPTYAPSSGAAPVDPVKWMNNTQAGASTNASSITSFTNALDAVTAYAATAPTWAAGSEATGPNWTTKGFRVASTQAMTSPDGTASGGMWSTYVNFTLDPTNGYVMTLTDFTIYESQPSSTGSYVPLWNAVTNAGGATYSLNQNENTILDAIWNSSSNAVSNAPQWVANLGGDAPNLFYAIFNAIAAEIIWSDKFKNNTPLPTDGVWAGYVPWVEGQENYNFEILAKGAAVIGGLSGDLTGDDFIALLEASKLAGTLVNPYFLELLKIMQQTSAYTYPSQDFLSYQSTGSDQLIGVNPAPLNGLSAFGEDATLTWYIGGVGGVDPIPEPSSALLLGLGAAAFAVRRWRYRRVSKS